MVKTYLRYRLSDTYGLIASPGGNVCVDASGTLAFTPQLEAVGLWSLKRGVQVARLLPSHGDSALRSEVCHLQCAPQGRFIAVGYVDGMVRTFDTDTAGVALTLNGHKRAVSSLAYSRDGSRLASGSRDTDVIVWDTVGEVGVARLRGHKDEVTGVAFLGTKGERVVSCSKDTLLKVWDVGALLCLQTVVGIRCEVWGLAVSLQGDRLVVAAGDARLRVWAVNSDSSGGGGGEEREEGVEEEGSDDPASTLPLSPLGSFTRTSAEKGHSVLAHPDGKHFAVLCSGRTLEVYRRRTPKEVRSKIMRDRKSTL